MKKTKRSKKSAAARMRPFWILILVALGAASVGGYYAASWSGFHLKRLTVSGNVIVPRPEIIRRAAIDPTANLWLQGMGKAAQRVKAIPYIDDVHVHRSLPADVTIDVTERKPFAVVQDGAAGVLIDRQARVLETGTSWPGLPVFVQPPGSVSAGTFLHGARYAAFIADFDTLAGAHVVVRRLSFDRLGDLLAVLPGGVVAKLGDDADLAQKAPLIEPILSQTQRQGRRIRALDLRAPKTPVVVYQ